MRVLMTAVATAGMLSLAIPAAFAQGVIFEAPGVSVGVGDRGSVRDARRDRDRAYRDQRGYYDAYGRADCRIVERERERRDGSIEIRRERICR